jgi:hypothetical protein
VRLNRIKVLVPQLSQFSSPGEPRSLHNCEQDLNNYLRTPDASGLIAKVDCINRRVLAHWPTLSLQDQESLIEEVQGLVRECQNRVQGVQVGDGPSITARRGHYLDTQLLARSLAGYRVSLAYIFRCALDPLTPNSCSAPRRGLSKRSRQDHGKEHSGETRPFSS